MNFRNRSYRSDKFLLNDPDDPGKQISYQFRRIAIDGSFRIVNSAITIICRKDIDISDIDNPARHIDAQDNATARSVQ